MNRTTIVFGVSLLCSATLAHAHGGQYRGPGCVVPPVAGSGTSQTGGGSASSGGPGGGSAPAAPSAPTTSAPSGIGGTTAGSMGVTARGGFLPEDLTRWEFWWEFGKDPYLMLRDAIHDARSARADDALWNPRLSFPARNIAPPTSADRQRVGAALAQCLGGLRANVDRDIASACLVGLAKIGPIDGVDLQELAQPFLAGGDQELRETAALSLGIRGVLSPPAVALLSDLVADNTAARTASGGSPVNERTRAFAAFGLGLLLQHCRDAGQAMRMTAALREVLTQPAAYGRELKVAVIAALSLFPAEWDGAAAGVLRSACVESLRAYYDADHGTGEQLVQAHVPTAIARLLQHDPTSAAPHRARFAADLAGGLSGRPRGNKSNPHVAQSCAMALGYLSQPWNVADDQAAPVGKLLVDVHREHHDQQTRSFAALALARMGGEQARLHLVREFGRANKAIEQPWVAVALGVFLARHAADDAGAAADARNVTTTLVRQLDQAKNPNQVGALAVALGLIGGNEAADALRQALVDHQTRDEAAGYLALALGMVHDARAEPDLRELRRNAMRRPFLLIQVVRALGMLGDHTLADELGAELLAPGQTVVRLSATAQALGQIGDRRSIEPLLLVLRDTKVTPLSRAFAAVALGSICDKDPLPWNAAYARFTNYRAATETLTNGASGILDIL